MHFLFYSVTKALQQVATILDTTRHPRLLEDAVDQTTYDDKYALTEFLTNTSIAAQMNALSRLGLDAEQINQVVGWAHTDQSSITLRFSAQDSCQLLKEQNVEFATGETKQVEQVVSSPSSNAGFFGTTVTPPPTTTKQTVVKVMAHVTEYHWKVDVSYRIALLSAKHELEVCSRTTSIVIVTTGGQTRHGQFMSAKPVMPLAERTAHPPIDANVTWLFAMLNPEAQVCEFTIDRSSADCKTPRRNKDTDAAVAFHQTLYDWTQITQGFFLQRLQKDILGRHQPVKPYKEPAPDKKFDPGTRGVLINLTKDPSFNGKTVVVREWLSEQLRYRVEPVDKDSGLPGSLLIKEANIEPENPLGPSLSLVTVDNLFCPVLPLVENNAVIPDVSVLLQAQYRSIEVALGGLSRVFPPRQLMKLVSVAEASILLICQHLNQLALAYQDGVDYVEHTLKQQLITAIGKEINSSDFDQFMLFHSRRLFGDEYSPRPFTYAVRRPNHNPDGILSIESRTTSGEQIQTMTRRVPGASCPTMSMPINAATAIEFTGDRILHGWMQHTFRFKQKPEYQLVARARQFSSFILVIGTMIGAHRFDPKDAIIVKDKDEVLIPLVTSTLPSAKEFKDSIASLSPEQQSFAQKFRQMQLESSVFGVCVIRIKPQLEKVLGLPDGSLTKEIQLTQDLMSLFVDYQISSDLMSFDGPANTDISGKMEAVRGHVKMITNVIDAAKEKQLREEVRKADMRAEMNFIGTEAYRGMQDSSSQLATDEMSITNDMGGSNTRGSALRKSSPPPMLMKAFTGDSGEGITMKKGTRRMSKLKATVNPPVAPTQTASVLPLTDELARLAPATKTLTGSISSDSSDGVDFTIIPKILDSKIEKYDTDLALRSTIIKTGVSWNRKSQENLLSPMKTSYLSSDAILDEKKKAFDLLDAITRSGVLPIDCSELHVVVGLSHCFDNDLMGTIIQNNMNPIEKVERSALLMASTIYNQLPAALLKDDDEKERLQVSFPQLLSAEYDLS
jgi:hypothetical protein